MAELGSLGWWEACLRAEPNRSLACAMHSAYHRLLSWPRQCVPCRLSDRDGRLSEIAVSYMEMMWAVRAAQVWCENNYADRDHAHIYSIIAQRLPEEWAKSERRCHFAPLAFKHLCEGKDWDERPAAQRLSQKLSRSTYTIFNRDRFDFFLIAAAICLDDDAWQKAMEGEEA